MTDPTPSGQSDKHAASSSQKSTPPWRWRLLMVIAATAYLIPETIFNSHLVNVSGQGFVDEHDLRLIELFGRMISGIGVSLLVCDALGSRLVRDRASGIALTVCVFLICWPAVFFGQKMLVDHYIINPSSAEDRQHAYLSQLARGALAKNAIKIEGIDYDEEHRLNPQELTFMALFGGMVYADDKLAEVFRKQSGPVIDQLVRNTAYKDFDVHWQNYSQLYEALSTQYRTYAEGSQRYNSVVSTIGQRQDDYWTDVQNEISSGWSRYEGAIEAHNARAEANAQVYGPKIFDYFKRRNKCRRQSCIDRLDAGYRKEITKLGLGDIPASYWLQEEKVSTTENVTKTIGNAIGSLGLSLLAQGVDAMTGGDGGFRESRSVYTNEIAHYSRKIKALPAFQQQLVKKTGYPSRITDYASFRMHPNTSRQVASKLTAKGLTLPGQWSIADRPGFNRAVASKVKQEARARWNAEVKERGVDLPPNLSWQKFQLQPDIQKRIREEMGTYYVSPTYVDWNRKTFKEKILDPAVSRKVREIQQTLDAQQATFADGGQNEQQGKEMLRAIVIPPISMGLSLLLVILTLVKLPGKYLSVVVQRMPKQRAQAEESRKISLITKMGKSAVITTLVFTLPLFAWNSDYTEEGSTVHYFLEKTAQSGSQATRFALTWVLHAQPAMHPVGETLEKSTGIYEWFSRNNLWLNQFDANVMGSDQG
ncbi:MAG: carboxypeptidase regulatory-like domain-containing protein [Pseudomonadota bacterium]